MKKKQNSILPPPSECTVGANVANRSDSPKLRLENIIYVYGKNTPFEVRALDGVSLDIHRGVLTGIIGHTGSGKSTLVRLLNGLDRAEQGRVLLDGRDIWENPKEIGKIRFRVGLVMQYPEYQLFEETVWADIAFGPRNMGLTDEELSTSLDEAITDMSGETDIDLTFNVFVNAKEGDCEKITVTGTVTDKDTEEIVEVDASITFSATAIVVSAEITEGEEVTTVIADLTKEETKDGVTYQFTAKVKQSGTSVTFADATFTYTKSSGDFTITVKLPEWIEEDVVVKGKVTSDKNSAAISINSVKYDNVEVELKLDITFNTSAEMPQNPADVKDVVELTEEDLEKVMEDFQSSKLGALILGFSGDAYEDEYYAA